MQSKGLLACLFVRKFLCGGIIAEETHEVKRAISSHERAVAVEIEGL